MTAWALLRADLPDGEGTQGGGPGWWRFSGPVAVLRAERTDEVPRLLAEVEAAARGGLWAVGLVAYEAAGAFDPALVTRAPAPGVPAAWFALFEAPETVAGPALRPEPPGATEGSLPARSSDRAATAGGRPALVPSITDREYRRGVAAIREAIARGDTYQANWTYRLRGRLGGRPGRRPGGDGRTAGGSRLEGLGEGPAIGPLDLFSRLFARQDASYAAFLDLGAPAGARGAAVAGAAVCSVSPELFFRRRGGRLLCRPMKGTAPRGRSPAEDRRLAAALRGSDKERAENLMIVDMMRNDLGRIARPGSVRVASLFEIERYATVHQMTSTVEARSDAGLAEVFAALFPCASVTGAPKARTMEILAALESTPRGLYTGAVGYVAPGGAARFSVAIRTAWLGMELGGAGADPRPWLEYGTGGGIVWESDPERELEETRIKARVLVEALEGSRIPRPGRVGSSRRVDLGRPVPAASAPPFRLLETLLWRPGPGYALLERHLDRLAASAEHFGFRVSLERVRGRLLALGVELEAGAAAGAGSPGPGRGLRAGARPGRRLRIRLLVGAGGEVWAHAAPLEPTRRPWTVARAAEPVDRCDPFLRHKTTRREVYERSLADARQRAERGSPDGPPLDDVLLWNQEGELTESTVANLVVRLDGRLLTPPAACGLLAGTFRAELLARGGIEERIVRVEDLGRVEALYLVNSLRGWIPIRLADEAGDRPARVAGKTGRDPGVGALGASAPSPLLLSAPSSPGGGRRPG